MKIEINGWLRKMQQFKFVAYLIVMCDIHTANKIFSKQAQSDSALIIDVPAFREDYRNNLKKLSLELGSEAKKRLPSLKLGKIVMAEAGKEDRVLTVENDDSSVDTVGEISLANATGDIEERLLAFQVKFVKGLLENFDARLQDPRIAHLLRRIFDFRKMPLQNTAAANEELMRWSDAEVEEVCLTHFPEFDSDVVKDEALVMRYYVRENQKLFMQDKVTDETSSGRYLALTGPGSIFETLFSRSDVCSKPIPGVLHIADYMIAFMWQSCNGERAASHINIAKSKERTLLNDETFEAVVFNTYNMPALHEINFDEITKKWIDAGNMSGTFKGVVADSAESASKVIRRHLEEKTPTFLFK
jgi:hypothetical protein